MSIRSVALAALLLVAAVSIGAAEDEPTTPGPSEEPQWTEFHSERGFVVSFPGTDAPKLTSQPIQGQNPLLQHSFEVSADKDTVYSVVVFEYPEGRGPNPPNIGYFVKVVTAYAKGSGTRVRKKGPTIIDRRQGYEAMAEDGRRKLNHLIDIIPNGDRIYMLVSAGPKGHAKSKDAERFRDSFRLLGGPAPIRSAANPPTE